MDRLEHFGYILHLGFWYNREYIPVEVYHTPLVLGLGKHLSHGFQHSQTFVSYNELYPIQAPSTEPLEETYPAGLVLFHALGST